MRSKGRSIQLSSPSISRGYIGRACSRGGELSKAELQERVRAGLAVVPRAPEGQMALGRDFRQDEIRTRWEEAFASVPNRTFTVLALRITCASGTYMRSLASRLARELGTSAFALSINRTRIGRYYAGLGPFGFWGKEY